MSSNRDVATMVKAAFPIDGKPVAGSFLSGDSMDLFEAALSAGCNLVTGGRGSIDTGTEQGGFLLDHGIKVMYNIAGRHIHGRPRLREPISATQTTIPIDRAAPETEDTRIVIDGEVIRYGSTREGVLEECERGADSTEPTTHAPWTILFWPGPLRDEIEEVRSSPNLWGYWALDDNPGIARSALRAMYRTLREVDPDPHPVCAGYTNTIALMNFGSGVCDMIMLYSYPVSKKAYFRDRTTMNTQWIMSHARRVVPGIPFIGIYQGFWGGQYQRDSPLATREIREQAEDYIREGSAGIMTFALLSPEKPGTFHGWNEDPTMIEAIGEVNAEVRSGSFPVPPEREATALRRIIGPGEDRPNGSIPGIPQAWRILGPFNAKTHKSLDIILGPEALISPDCPAPDLAASFEGKWGRVSWHTADAYAGTCVYSEMWGASSSNDSAALAYCLCRSDREVEAVMKMGADVDMRVYLNGIVAYDSVGSRGIALDDEETRVRLRRGENHLLVKTINEKGCWAFVLRFTDEEGRPLRGLTFQPDSTI